MKRVVGSVFVATLLFASPAFATSQPQVKTVSSNQSQESKTIKNNIFNLSDQQMKNAILIGNGGLNSISKFQVSQRLPIINDTMNRWQPTVNVTTPYYSIALRSYSSSSNYEQYTLADAKKLSRILSSSNELSFSLRAFGNKIDFAKNINIVFKQGEKVLQPTDIYGKNELASDSGFNSPPYTIGLSPSFDINKIDFSKPAELIYLYAGKELSVTYKVDFSKIK
ncbi:hypothetical protein A3844_18850 [Paenibacillus helianthi]|uniref:Uncharacterized protein n=1 Tax=Paenibacillus helianthi TaxID=1349432 RepID=A0ABX3EK97_9BACL|nr:hypothetical protein [Paenibacillus helianthi]OKP84844.1 hypothetical protein A3844_18850 [Paenibacillus helianthi]